MQITVLELKKAPLRRLLHMSPSTERKRPRRDERMELPYRNERMECPRRDECTQRRERPCRDERPRRDERPPLDERTTPLRQCSRSLSRGRESGPLYRLTLPLTNCASPRRGTDSLGQGHARQSSIPIIPRPPLGTCANGRLLHHHHCRRRLAAKILVVCRRFPRHAAAEDLDTPHGGWLLHSIRGSSLQS